MQKQKRRNEEEVSSTENKSIASSKSSSHSRSRPYRQIANLFVHQETFTCATSNSSLCITCAYKIANFDIAQDETFTKAVPNTRPELCTRARFGTETGSEGNYGFKKGMKVLCVGDGDFTFSLALARILCSPSETETEMDGGKRKRKQKRNKSKVVASSYESFATLQKVYPQIQNTIDELEKLNCEVCYNVDATNLVDTLPLKKEKKGYNRIIWNFPCTAIANGQDGQNQQMLDNQMLVKSFIRQTEKFISQDGEIHFLHKTKPPYDQWGIERVAVDDELWDQSCPFEYKGRVVFDKSLLPPYTPRKALDKKSFPCHDACSYIFGWTKSSDHPVFPSTIPQSKKELKGDTEAAGDDYMLKVTENIIDELRGLHLKHGSQKDRKKRKIK
mmetsp:Transcript_28720/g.43906  ORF Transcript_28720/g.43906 Transcript_28720/m.43906 type:complete len:388 (+) Transcript_28720:109-1272(+)